MNGRGKTGGELNPKISSGVSVMFEGERGHQKHPRVREMSVSFTGKSFSISHGFFHAYSDWWTPYKA